MFGSKVSQQEALAKWHFALGSAPPSTTMSAKEQESSEKRNQLSLYYKYMLDDIVDMVGDDDEDEFDVVPPKELFQFMPPSSFSSSSSSSSSSTPFAQGHFPRVNDMPYQDMTRLLESDIGLLPDFGVCSKTTEIKAQGISSMQRAVEYQQESNKSYQRQQQQQQHSKFGSMTKKTNMFSSNSNYGQKMTEVDHDLASLDSQISKLMGKLTLLHHKDELKVREVSDKVDRYVEGRKTRPLKQMELLKVDQILNCAPRAVVIDAFNIELTGDLMRCLRPGTWLNDEVINFYMELLKERNARKPDSLKCHFFSSFFYTKMIQGGYQYKNVRRWSKRAKVDIIALDRVFIPVNLNNTHWVLAVINFQDKQIEYHDSFHSSNNSCLQNLQQYIADEAKHYHDGMEYDFTGWKLINVKTCPTQNNGCDCGVFTCKNVDYLSDSRQATFTQANMPYFRKRMVLEIHNKFVE